MFECGESELLIMWAITRSALVYLLCVLLLSGCVTLDFDDTGNAPISTRMVSQMREKNMRPSDPVLVRIFKQESELELWKRDESGNFALLKTYPMCRWSGQLGPKTKEGDRQAPEGFYAVNASQLNPKSKYFLSFDLGYPNRLERAKGYTGSALMVHGACSSSGCYAISDEYIAELYAVVREALRGGQQTFQVQAYPFRMTPQNMAAHADNPNFEFWMELKAGYDRFEVLREPPEFGFCEGGYRFGAPMNDQMPANPLSGCPYFEPEPQAVAQKRASDAETMRGLLSRGLANGYSYADGGMHPAFRKILARKGPEFLSRKTSSTSVPISRPQAALADPYSYASEDSDPFEVPFEQ